MNLEDYGGRRFIVVLLIVALTTLMLAFGKLAGSEYVTLILATGATYVGAGTFESHSKIRADVQKTVANAQASVAPDGGEVTPVSP